MILNSKILDKLINSSFIKETYPIIDSIVSNVIWDEDKENPTYIIFLDIYTNSADINHLNMYQKGLDPHYLMDRHILTLLKFINVRARDIEQVYLRVINKNGVMVYG